MPAPKYKGSIQFDTIAETVSDVYAKITDDLLINIASSFKANQNLGAVDWEVTKLAGLGKLTKENARVIASQTPGAYEAVEKAFTESALKALESIEPDLVDAVKKGLLEGTPVKMSETAKRIILTYQGQAIETLNLVNTVMLESSKAAYRRVVSDTLMYEKQLESAQQILNASTGSVVSGAESRRTALRSAIKRLNDNGLTGFTDAGNHKWSPEAYVNMDIRTTCGNVANQAVFSRNTDYGNDLIWVRTKFPARPLCYPYQGKVYSTGNRSGTATDLSGNTVNFTPLSSTSYGEPAGLFGINCGHSPPNVFIPGASAVRHEDRGKENNDKKYEQTVKQRSLERKTRETTRQAVMYDAAGDKEMYEKYTQKAKQLTAEYKVYCKDRALPLRLDRMTVHTFKK